MRRNDGFTLIELVLAMAILLVILLMAVPSLKGIMNDRGLRRSLDEMNRFIVQAQERSMSEGRSYLIVWRNKQFALRPEGYLKGEDHGPVATLKWQKGDAYTLSFPASIEEEPPAEWVFWPSGNCEPAVVTFRGASGAWKATYSPLTARPQLDYYAPR
jgi:prepilin-type N-terminal cleavage/methylation domain-containing protein